MFKMLLENESKYLPITDLKMTRFWISLDEGVKFVLKCFNLMYGGEILFQKCLLSG